MFRNLLSCFCGDLPVEEKPIEKEPIQETKTIEKEPIQETKTIELDRFLLTNMRLLSGVIVIGQNHELVSKIKARLGDDCSVYENIESNNFSAETTHGFFYTRRQSAIVSVLDPYVRPVIRGQADYVFITNQLKLNDVRHIYEKFVCFCMPMDELDKSDGLSVFRDMMVNLCSKNRCLVIDNRNNKIYWFSI